MINYAISFADCEYECHNKDCEYYFFNIIFLFYNVLILSLFSDKVCHGMREQHWFGWYPGVPIHFIIVDRPSWYEPLTWDQSSHNNYLIRISALLQFLAHPFQRRVFPTYHSYFIAPPHTKPMLTGPKIEDVLEYQLQLHSTRTDGAWEWRRLLRVSSWMFYLKIVLCKSLLIFSKECRAIRWLQYQWICRAVDNLITCYEDSYVKYCGEGLRS